MFEVEKLPIKEYLSWINVPTTNEILDGHLSTIVMLLNNANFKKQLKIKDIMMTLTKQDKKDSLSKELKTELAKFGNSIKIEKKG